LLIKGEHFSADENFEGGRRFVTNIESNEEGIEMGEIIRFVIK